MRLAERIEEYRVALELFPLCVKCGGDLSALRLSQVTKSERVNRFAHIECPEVTHAAD